MKHTPGPWESADWVIYGKGMGRIIATIEHNEYITRENVEYYESQKANARLIAAAPILLKTLLVIAKLRDSRGLQYHNENSVSVVSPAEIAKKAIAKAEGK